ncbi:universal stress protein [Natronobacterium gregoryi]|uniref:Universal stress protein n=2 Tax=Natronobacterium gregoryi TaxID=44930 RepID=L0AF44_NATGS|nr:universal stress protein [Natronobacterium gregoryi]AFZ72461.1 universal stress protein UspA-like protein [Natronobacterium gregoryi SP2]ELY74331.1 UspA domain-containing protein [Natronobacterium gregoryi SP2]PLK21433.1 universal stress protein [Natronobacterium gregoryi SP2]SFI77991.1 Universal stress protein family protein [Natronobacterium gregoryi]
MYRILVALDTDVARAESQASTIESLPGSTEDVTAVLTHVFQDNPDGRSVQQLDGVRHIADRFDEAGIDYEYYETSGEPAPELIEAATALDADMLCLSGRKQTPTGKVIFGSVTQSVILETDLPVVTVSPGE